MKTKQDTRFFLMIILLASSFCVAGQEGGSLITDRPDKTESAVSVAPGYLQIESGFHFEVDESNGSKSYLRNLNATLFRYGVMPRLEVRVGVGYSSLSEEGTTLEGFDPLTFGFKAELFSQSGIRPQMAILNTVIPGFTGSSHFRSDYWSGELLTAMAWDLKRDVGMGCNLGVVFEEESRGAVFPYSSALGFPLGNNLGGFVELFGLLSENAGPAHSSNVGLTWLCNEGFQLDGYASKGLNERAPDWFVGFGLSWRFKL